MINATLFLFVLLSKVLSFKEIVQSVYYFREVVRTEEGWMRFVSLSWVICLICIFRWFALLI